MWLVEYLIKNGLATDDGSALEHAIKENKEEILVLIVEGGANVNMGDYADISLLQKACHFPQHPSARVVRCLLKHGADVNANKGYIDSALEEAARSSADNIVRMLLDHGATDINIAFQKAAEYDHNKIISTLLEYGADINYQGGYYCTALQAACVRGKESMVRRLLDLGANVDTEGGEYHTALHAAAHHSNEDIVGILLDHRATLSGNRWRHGYAIHDAITTFQERAKSMTNESYPSVEMIGNVAKSARTIKLLASRGAHALPDAEWQECKSNMRNERGLQQFQDNQERYLASIDRYLDGKESISVFRVADPPLHV